MSKAKEFLSFLKEDRDQVVKEVTDIMTSRGFMLQHSARTVLEFVADSSVDFSSLQKTVVGKWVQTSEISSRELPEPMRDVFISSPMTSVTITFSHVPESKMVSVDITA